MMDQKNHRKENLWAKYPMGKKRRKYLNGETFAARKLVLVYHLLRINLTESI